jgi:hypothetical protein
MDRMKQDLHSTNESLTKSERVLKGMKSITGAIGNMFSSAPKSEVRSAAWFSLVVHAWLLVIFVT